MSQLTAVSLCRLTSALNGARKGSEATLASVRFERVVRAHFAPLLRAVQTDALTRILTMSSVSESLLCPLAERNSSA